MLKMTNKIIKKDQIRVFLDKLAKQFPLVAPVANDEIVSFKAVSSGEEVVLDGKNSVVPPKDIFFPQSEHMFKFNTADNGFEVTEVAEAGERVVFGVRPCDLKSLLRLDPVFDGKFKDNLYLDKRAKTYLIGLSCSQVEHTCFCTAFGGSPTNSEGADLHFTLLGDKYLVEVLTEKGEKLLAIAPELFSDVQGSEVSDKEKLDQELSAQTRKVDLTGVKEFLDNNFYHPYWEELSLKCLGCGACTYVCPTCHCFDINDHVEEGYTGVRFRCWDTCMFSDFTNMAGGHNPRPNKVERVRNRFMHKLKYHTDRYSVDGCVGCGRCIEKCPVNMDITSIISDVKEVK